MTKPIIAANSPTPIDLEAGKTYAFCACGKSSAQPFCDGSHGGTEFRPKIFQAEKDGTAYLCRCKSTDNAPYCDGSHKSFADDQVGQEAP